MKVSRSDVSARTVTHLDSPDNQLSPTTTTMTTITTTITTTTTTSTIEKDRSDDDTLQHAFKTPNNNLKPVSSFRNRFQPLRWSHEWSPSSTRRPNQSPSSSQRSAIASSSFLSTQS